MNELIEMDSQEVEDLAFDVACAFFKDDQLCTRYDLKQHQLESIKTQQAFKKEVDEVHRLLNDDGSEFVVAAKKMTMDGLIALREIVNDKLTTDNARIKAAAGIFAMAKVLHLPNKDAGGAGVGSLIINTNLQLNQDPKGVYSLESKPEVVTNLIEAEYSEVKEFPLVTNSDLL